MICTGRARRFSNELGFNRDWVEKCLAHEEKYLAHEEGVSVNPV